MNAPFAVEAHGSPDLAGLRQALGILDAGERPVDGAFVIGAGGGDDRMHDVVPAMAGIGRVVVVQFSDRFHRHPHRRRVIAGSVHETFQPGGTGRDFPNVDATGRCLDQGLDADGARELPIALDLRQQRFHYIDILGTVDLGHHDQIDAITGGFHHLDQIPVGIMSI